MEKELKILNRVQKIDAPDYLYSAVLSKIEENRNTISVKWTSIAAAIVLLLICTDVFIIVQNKSEKNKTEVSTLIPLSNNYLYNE